MPMCDSRRSRPGPGQICRSASWSLPGLRHDVRVGQVHPREDDPAARAVSVYLGALGGASPEWPFAYDAAAAAIRRHLTEIAVFRLTPER